MGKSRIPKIRMPVPPPGHAHTPKKQYDRRGNKVEIEEALEEMEQEIAESVDKDIIEDKKENDGSKSFEKAV